MFSLDRTDRSRSSLSPETSRSDAFVCLWALALIAAALLVGTLASGCALGLSDEDASEQSRASLVEGSVEALGVLALLNDPTTTFVILDEDVALDRRAASALVCHRKGPDGLDGTADDVPFTTIEEVDAVPYVGPAALDKLVVYAGEHGWIQGDDDLLGVFDGVSFSIAQGRRALAVANRLDAEALRERVGLDSRAVSSITEARPLGTVDELADCYYVGQSMLGRIKTYVTGAGLISDLDKTVIPPYETELPDGAYPGVAALYRAIENGAGSPSGDVHFVTARGQADLDGIPEWLEANGVPAGPIATGGSPYPWLARPEKVADISAILDAHPDTSFLLFGDTSHVDPDAFRDVMAAYPHRIRAALVHYVRGISEERREGLHLFENYAEAAAILFGLGEIDETTARSIMLSARDEGLDISNDEIEQLLDAHRG